MRVLITGAAGFIGSHLVEHLLKHTAWEIAILDRLDSSGNQNRLTEIDGWNDFQRRVEFYWHDLRAPVNELLAAQLGEFEYIFHLAAATHVDRSIVEPLAFVYDNVVATCNLLDFARVHQLGSLKKFLYFSTDEVFGPAHVAQAFREWDRYRSGNPYAATKAGAEELCLAYANTYRLPVMISHCMNVFGERQHPEKYIPLVIRNVLKGGTIYVHANPNCAVPGSRFYIHARNVAAATCFLIEHGQTHDKYNIVGECEVDNLELAERIAGILERPLNYKLVDFHSSRPGHDLRYALDGQKMRDMGWRVPVTFAQSLEKTVKWTVEHPQWLGLPRST